MSTNCTKCLSAPRASASLLCADCQREVTSQSADKAEEQYPDFRDFLSTWGPHCGASLATFKGHLFKMLVGCLATADTIRNQQKQPQEAADPQEDPSSALSVLRALSPTLEEDFLLACRFLYYVKSRPILPDAIYDAAEAQFINRDEVDDTPLMNPGSDNANDYSDRVRALTFYLHLLSHEAGQRGHANAAKVKKDGELF